MATFVERLVVEKDELNERLTKLHQFIEGNDIYNTLPTLEKTLMRTQLGVMEAYYGILTLRVLNAETQEI